MEKQFNNHHLHNDFWSIPTMNQAKKLIYDIEKENDRWILSIMSTDDFIFDYYFYYNEDLMLEDLDLLEETIEMEMLASS